MEKIRLLSDFEIGCIAAGEVIENPSSIMKELIENAIDAKSTEIKIFFKQGGIEEIIVIDNGCGMSYNDLSLALVPHATSKLLNINELYCNNNVFFGFRGEALSSIMGVSRIVISSREANAEYGFSITADNGKLFKIEKTACNFGTTVSVTNLFEKVPVRKKYLSSIKNQEKNIFYIITGLVLSHPEINFIIYKDNKLFKVYQATVDFLSRAYQFTCQDKNKYSPIIYEDIYMKLEGVISFYEHGYYDRSKIFILANNRLIKQYKITQSCVKAYHSENFVKKYPELFLNITVSPDQIDVNVHPRKEEVLFLYQKKIEQLLTEILVGVLEKRTKQIFLENISYKYIPQINEEKINIAIKPEPEKRGLEKTEYKNDEIKNELIKEIPIINQAIYNDLKFLDCENKKEKINTNLIKNNLLDDVDNKIFIDQSNSIQIPLFEKKNNKIYLGILAQTYILLLENDALLFVDQHALHEKILYEKYINDFKNNKIINKQQLLFEEKITIDDNQKKLFDSNSFIFNSLGIYYEILENAIIVKAFPGNFLKFNIISLLMNYLVLLNQNKEKTFMEKQHIVLHEIAAMHGCKNAVKAGDRLDIKEVEFLIKSIGIMNNGTYCPHGRPIYYQMTIGDLHTFFKRT